MPSTKEQRLGMEGTQRSGAEYFVTLSYAEALDGV